MANEKQQFALQEIYVFVTRDAQGDEGVVSIINPAGQVQPLISFDTRQLDMMKDVAKQIVDETKQDVRLLKFTTREELEQFEHKVVKLAQPSDMSKL
ncbi:MAG: hypothetical protein DRJ03_01920 [Chloroflexi bacterium]|nr:MAG: hypothetical protein DRJ03_01920 [Chloroflexota bacterium]